MLTGHASYEIFFCDEAKTKLPNKNTCVYMNACMHVRVCVCSYVSELRESKIQPSQKIISWNAIFSIM